jgi:hypothetical protein
VNINMGLVKYGYEAVLVGVENKRFLFSERYIISNENKTFLAVLKKFYQAKKIKKGTLRVALSPSKIKSFVLGNLNRPLNKKAQGKWAQKLMNLFWKNYKDEVFPFVLAHLKQHVGERLSRMSVDFTRISDHQIWVGVCPQEEVESLMRFGTKNIPVVAIEPSLQALCRVLNRENFEWGKRHGFVWIDEVPLGKKFRLTFFEGVEVIWEKVFENAPEGELGPALKEYCAKTQRASEQLAQELYLFMESESALVLTEEIRRQELSFIEEIHQILPEHFGLKQADEFIPYGLALR